MKQRERQKLTGMLALSVALLGGSMLAGPAAAQDERRWGQGPALDRYESPASARNRMQDQGRAAFERGYRDGRQDERRRGARAGSQDLSMGLAWNDARQGEAFEHLERAAAQLRRALVLMRREPTLPRVQGALVQAREALIRTQNAMTWLPPATGGAAEPRYDRRSGRGIGAEDASGGWAS
jgi:hypothetical protein